MPNTDGPARGLRKAVCSNSPLAANAPPHSRAVTAPGSRDSMMMYCQLVLALGVPESIDNISAGGMLTEPMPILSTNSNSKARDMALIFNADMGVDG